VADSVQVRPTVVRPSLAMCDWTWLGAAGPCTIALVQPSKVHLFIIIPIFMYLHVKIPTKLVEPH
jgi:hypothetical protein